MLKRIERADGSVVWRARLGQKGVQATFDTKREAQEYLDEQRNNQRRERAGLDVQQGPISFNDLAELWKANSSPSDWRLRMLTHSEKRWGKVMVRSMKPEGIGSWLHALKLSGKTKKHILETLRQVLNAGVEWGYLHKSPARPGAIKPPSEKRLRPILPFESWAEVEKVAALCGEKYGPVARFICASGLRAPSEVFSLKWSDVDRINKTLRVNGTKTENAPRTIPLFAKAEEVVAGLPRQLDGKLFASFDWRGFTRNHWTPALEKAGLEYRTPYEMRHTFATLALEAGADISDVSKVLGHANIDITVRYYAKWTRPRLDRMRELLDRSQSETGTSAESAE